MSIICRYGKVSVLNGRTIMRRDPVFQKPSLILPSTPSVLPEHKQDSLCVCVQHMSNTFLPK